MPARFKGSLSLRIHTTAVASFAPLVVVTVDAQTPPAPPTPRSRRTPLALVTCHRSSGSHADNVVPQIFEEVLEVNARFARVGILSRRSDDPSRLFHPGLIFARVHWGVRFSADVDAALRGARRIYPRTGQAAIASTLLGFLAVCAPAHAQKLAGTQPTQLAADDVEAPPRPEWPGVGRSLFGEVGDQALDAGRPRYDLLSRPRMDWANVARDEVVAPGFLTQQPGAQHPAPAHTGFKALLFETGTDFKAFPRRTSTWVILAIGGGAAAIAHPVDHEVTERLVGSDAVGRFFVAGKWIGTVYAQAGTAVGLYVVGRYVLPHADGEPTTNKVSHLGFDLLRALIVSQALTQGIKITVQRNRPTGECCAFPSGHSSAAFATASVLERHLGYRGAWPTFAIAGYVAASRLHDNRHFLSDVLFGGALGIASGWTVVGRHGRSTYALAPVLVPGGFMVAFSPNPSRRPSH